VSPPVNLPHNTLAVDTFNPNIVYVGTDFGIWRSIDGGGTWTHMGPESGLPNVAVHDVQINDTTNRVVVFTHGRGAFVLSATATTATTSTTTPPTTPLTTTTTTPTTP